MQFFTGHIETKLDESFRFNVPASIKKIFNDNLPSFAISRGDDESLKLCTEEQWNKILFKLKSLNDLESDVREFKRKFLYGAEVMKVEKAGKLTIPANLREKFKAGDEIVINGAITHYEIWLKSTFDKRFGFSSEKSLDELQQNMASKYGLNFNED